MTTFVDAVLAIEKHPTLEMCPNDQERNGLHDICVYSKVDGVFVGKLRWPRGFLREGVGWVSTPADIDEEVAKVLGV